MRNFWQSAMRRGEAFAQTSTPTGSYLANAIAPTNNHRYATQQALLCKAALRGVHCTLITSAFVAVLATAALAQIPRINTFFPIGAKAGTSVDVEVRGASLEGAHMLLVHGKGLSGVVAPGDIKVDETNKPVWQSKCSSCHELRSPANRSMTSGQWSATVERMVKLRSAPLSADESTKVTQFLVSASRAGRVTAQIKVEPDTMPGIYEVRVATARGISSPYWFEVGNLTEIIAANVSRDQAQPVIMPCVVNGCFTSQGERHFFKFPAAKGERFVFNLKAYRYSETNQLFFSPNLRLYDPTGKEIVENHGYFEMDPLIDWICPANGNYTLEARDLLGRPNPASVYRMTMGRLPYDSAIYPPAGQMGTVVSATVQGKVVEGLSNSFTFAVPQDYGLINAPSPFGAHPFWASPYHVVRDDSTASTGIPLSQLPAAFAGVISKVGETDVFPIQGSGTWEFEGYATRLGSPVYLVVGLAKGTGSPFASFGSDGRMTANLEAGQTYQLRVSSGLGQAGAGPTATYAIEARPARPGLECVVRPDNITIRPGVATAAQVILTRREGVEGDVTISAEDLPSGVTVKTLAIQPDRNIAWLQFSAAPNAAPVEKPIRIFATAKGPLGESKVQAIPQEEYRLNNDPRFRNWHDVVVAVRGQSDFSLEFVDGGPIRVHPRKLTPVKIRIKRRTGFAGNVVVYLSGLPLGWYCNAEATTGNELTLNVRPDGNDTNPFLKRDPKWTPIAAVLEGSTDEYRFAFGTVVVKRVDIISEKDD